MSDSLDSATRAVLAAIATHAGKLSNASNFPDESRQALHVLSATLDALRNHAAAPTPDPDTEPRQQRTADSRQQLPAQIVIPAPGVAAFLADLPNGAQIISRRHGSLWEKTDGWWWTTGSEVPLDALDLAAQGPFAILRIPAS